MTFTRHSIIGLSVLTLAACTPESEIASFEECVAAGNPVMESYPRQCSANGQTFVEVFDEITENPRNVSVEAGDTVTSPLTVTGEASGWYFEASFPVRLLDGHGNEIAVAPAQAQSDWMTENYVPFSVTLTFTTPSTTTGTLVLERDNPSGLPENDESIQIPVQF